MSDGYRERLDVDRLQLGDPLLWQAGEYLAVDAVVKEGEGQISQALLTGESDAIPVMPGQTVLAGALNGATPCGFASPQPAKTERSRS